VAFERLVSLGILEAVPLIDPVAAVSCGVVRGAPLLDLDYEEDSTAESDTNFVLTGSGGIVEVQGTAEERPFTESQFLELLGLAKKGIGELVAFQKGALGIE
jgi:ribonuclease PH